MRIPPLLVSPSQTSAEGIENALGATTVGKRGGDVVSVVDKEAKVAESVGADQFLGLFSVLMQKQTARLSIGTKAKGQSAKQGKLEVPVKNSAKQPLGFVDGLSTTIKSKLIGTSFNRYIKSSPRALSTALDRTNLRLSLAGAKRPQSGAPAKLAATAAGLADGSVAANNTVDEVTLLAKGLKKEFAGKQNLLRTTTAATATATTTKAGRQNVGAVAKPKKGEEGLPAEAKNLAQHLAVEGNATEKNELASAAEQLAAVKPGEINLPPSVATAVPPTTVNSLPAAEVKVTTMTGGVSASVSPVSSVSHTSTLVNSVRQQVLQHLAGKIEGIDGSEKLVLRLHPENLGQVELTLSARNDQLSVVMVAGSQEAEAALRENLRDLSDRISERSTRFSQVEVRVDHREVANNKAAQRQEQKHGGREGQQKDDGSNCEDSGGSDHRGKHTRHRNEAWENVMSWELAETNMTEEG